MSMSSKCPVFKLTGVCRHRDVFGPFPSRFWWGKDCFFHQAITCSCFICVASMYDFVTTYCRHTERRTRKKQFRTPVSRARMAETALLWQTGMMTFPAGLAASTSRRRQRNRQRSRQRYSTTKVHMKFLYFALIHHFDGCILNNRAELTK